MTILPIKKWQYPVGKMKKFSFTGYYSALISAKDGFYPVSINKLLHNGIHIDTNVLTKLDEGEQYRVDCIADGEVIAYRVNDYYPKIDYGDAVAFFSTGFVLVRHLLEMEPVPEKSTEEPTTQTTTTSTDETSSTSESTETKQSHQLYFYSLYMHIADAAYYDKNSQEPCPAFWEQDIYRVIEDDNLDFVEGQHIRQSPNDNDTILATLQQNTKVNLNLDFCDTQKKWYAVSSLVDEYTSIPQLSPFNYQNNEQSKMILGWIYTGKEMTESEYEVNGTDTKFLKSRGLRVRSADKKQVISMLPIGTELKIIGQGTSKSYVEIAEILRGGKPTIPISIPDKNYVYFNCLKQITRGKLYNEVVVLNTPYPIKAEELIGHIGHYQRQKESITKLKNEYGNYIDIDTLPADDPLKGTYYKPLLHVECFTCDDLTDFIEKTKNEAKKLDEQEKFFLAISQGAKLAKPTTSNVTIEQGTEIKVVSKKKTICWLQIETSEKEKRTLWVDYKDLGEQLKTSDKVKLSNAMPAWSVHPLQVNELSKSTQTVGTPLLFNLYDKTRILPDNQAMDEFDTPWWLVEIMDDKNLKQKGWVSTKGEHVERVSKWDWFNFQPIEEKTTLHEFYSDVAISQSRDQEAPSLDKFNPTLKATLSILDKQYYVDTKQYSHIEDKCFRGVINQESLLDELGHLLIKSESEWYSEINEEELMPKWEELNDVMISDIENLWHYLKEGKEEAKNTYLEKLQLKGESAETIQTISIALENKRREILRKYDAYQKANPEKNDENSSEEMNDDYVSYLEKQINIWEKEKERISNLLWWPDLVKKLSNQNQEEQSSPPATLSSDGKAWHIHPVALMKNFDSGILFQKGDKHEIIREINIRLAGFGGNVPTEEFTERTENMIKQFQRDYMKVAETGVVCMRELIAIDRFRDAYPVDSYFVQSKCRCGECGGFGLGKHADERQNGDIIEQQRKYEYPGLHRTLFWVLRAWQFYLSEFDKRNMRISLVYSGYRCWKDNDNHKRGTTNHMGKAVDIHMVYNNTNITLQNLCDDAREVMIKYCGVYYRWDTSNVISLEAGDRVKRSTDRALAPTWVHFDVRAFKLQYLQDEYFAKNIAQVNGLALLSLI